LARVLVADPIINFERLLFENGQAEKVNEPLKTLETLPLLKDASVITEGLRMQIKSEGQKKINIIQTKYKIKLPGRVTWAPIIVTYLIDFLCVSVFSNRAIDVYFLYIKNLITKMISAVNLLRIDKCVLVPIV